MAIRHDQMDYNKIFIMNENHKAWYSLWWWHVCHVYGARAKRLEAERQRGGKWHTVDAIPKFGGYFPIIVVVFMVWLTALTVAVY